MMAMPVADVEQFWLTELSPLSVSSNHWDELRVRDRSLVLRDWVGAERILLDSEDLFGTGPAEALGIRSSSRSGSILVAGEEGTALLHLDLDIPRWRSLAQMPRLPNELGGMCRLDVTLLTDVVVLRWELGVLVIRSDLELLWRQDLDWNHSLLHLDDAEIWFDLMYESDEVPQRIGEEPWGFSLADGRELMDKNPPGSLPAI